MGDEIKINVEDGGTVFQGQPFTWKNTGPDKLTAFRLGDVCKQTCYEVPAAANGKDGENRNAFVLDSATPGKDYPYSVSDGIKNTSPVLHVDTGMPKPK